jgi:hypothetical protein
VNVRPAACGDPAPAGSAFQQKPEKAMWHVYARFVLLPALGLGAVLLGETAEAQARRVTINRVALSDAEVATLERQYRVRVLDGEYWYDARAGLWGFWGGPVAGFAAPGLRVGGALPRDASGGGTGVIVNGRELHPQDVAALRRIMPVLAGRYWMDHLGWGGYEGGPPLWNVYAIAAHSAPAAGGGGSWVHRGVGGGISSGGGCIGWIDGGSSATVGCD